MAENIFTAILTFSMMAGGALAFGSEVLGTSTPPSAQVATLPTVSVVGHRVAASEPVTLPTVVVTGHCRAPTEVALDSDAIEQRVQ